MLSAKLAVGFATGTVLHLRRPFSSASAENRATAAAIGLERQSLQEKIKQLGISRT